MIKWPITYTDYNGEERTEDFYFNLNKAEVMELNFDSNGVYSEYLQRILNQRDAAKMGEEFKRIILKSYGEKSDDGRRFIKSKDLTDAFEQSEAYVELYMRLVLNPEDMEKFVEGVFPKIPSDGNPSLENHMTLV